jgi:hypothetical protein
VDLDLEGESIVTHLGLRPGERSPGGGGRRIPRPWRCPSYRIGKQVGRIPPWSVSGSTS